MRRAAVLLWLVRHPAVVALAFLVVAVLGGYRLFLTARARVMVPAAAHIAFAPIPTDYVPGEVLVCPQPGDERALRAGARAVNAVSADPVRGAGFYRLKLPAGRAVMDAVGELAGVPGVAWAEPNYRVRTCRVPEGARFEELWGMRNVGRSFSSRSCGNITGNPDADIAAYRAWDSGLGSRKVIVGIIDTGIDYTHPNLKANIWTNPGEIPDNGIDDDKNGYVDDVHGYDFVNRDGDPKDDHGHGTHVAGTIGAAGSDATGVVGVNWEVSLMALKFLDANGFGDIATAAEAAAYARSFGVKVTSNSWGGGGFSKALYEAIRTSGALFVAAAGNGYADTDLVPTYPAGYDLPNVVAVAASDPRDDLGCFSNWGATSVDVAAPGVAVLSALPTYPCTLTEHGLQQGYDYLDGTSMATPHASGALALLLSKHPRESDAQRRHRLLATARHCASLRGRCVANGSIDLNTAVTRRLVPPIPNAGGDTAVPPGGEARLDAAASVPYPGRNLASFVWSERGKVLRRSRRPEFLYRSDQVGIHSIDLVVVDNEGQTSHDTVCVEVADHVMAGKAITFERKDRRTLLITLEVHDVVSRKPVAGAAVEMVLVTPGSYCFRAEGRTDEEGRFRGEWRVSGRLWPGEYQARLNAMEHEGYAWDRKRTTGKWRE